MINVDARKWMKEMRMKLGLSREKMAAACQCSKYLLEIMEDNGAITLPGIASRIAHRYGMDVHQYNDLVSPDRRARVLPAYKNPPGDKDFTWSKYYEEHVCREVDAV